MNYDELKTFTDGGARGNPGPAASGVVIMTMDDKVVEAFGVYLGETTNNQAEYKAIKFALEAVAKYKPTRVHCYMDSQLAQRQLIGQYKVKNADLRPIFLDILNLASKHETTFEHIYREANKLADAEVNKAIDEALQK